MTEYEPYTGDKWFDDFGIVGVSRGDPRPNVKVQCPKCGPYRRKKSPCLYAETQYGVWNCHHCGWGGNLRQGETHRSVAGTEDLKRNYRRPTPPQVDETSPHVKAMYEWFERRAIPRRVVDRNRIVVAPAWDPNHEEEAPAIQFPFYRGDDLINVKYRRNVRVGDAVEKSLWLHPGAERCFFGLNDLVPGEPVVIVEGEPDKLAVETCGLRTCVSVPNGAPPINSRPTPATFSYLEDPYFQDRVTKATKIVVAVDSDAPGVKLGDEIARWFGAARTYKVDWPEGIKDANECLLEYGVTETRKIIDAARPWPVAGIIDLRDYSEKLRILYNHGLPKGRPAGWNLDRFYRPLEGAYTVLSGTPHSGTSQFVNNFFVRLARSHGWRFALFSPEYQPYELLIADLVAIATQKPFEDDAGRRITPKELTEAEEWVREHFTLLDVRPRSVDALLEAADIVAGRRGIRGLSFDPWSSLSHRRERYQLATDYIEEVNDKFRDFGRDHGCHVWNRVHPTKLQKETSGSGEYEEVDPYNVAGSAHWYGQSDYMVILRRFFKSPDKPTEVIVKKVRFRATGALGRVYLRYDRATGMFEDCVGPNGAEFQYDDAAVERWENQRSQYDEPYADEEEVYDEA